MLIEKIRTNGLIRVIKQKVIIIISRIRGLVFTLINVSGFSAPKLRVHDGVRCLSKRLVIGENAVIGPGCSFGGSGLIRLGNNVVLNRNVHIDASVNVEIGELTLIGPDCYLVDSNHVVSLNQPLNSGNVESKPVIIGREVWLGRGVTVLPGVVVGEKSVIGAGSVVTRSIPPGCVAAGVPARVIRSLE